jgi:hypothetical protein
MNPIIYAGVVDTGAGNIDVKNSNIIGGENNKFTIKEELRSLIIKLLDDIKSVDFTNANDKQDVDESIATIQGEIDNLSKIYEEGELNKDTTVSKMEIVINRGFRGKVTELVDFYNLDAIIAVGYCVSSLKATRFRQWATKILNEFYQKGICTG